MRVAIWAQGDPERTASTWYRVAQFLPLWQEAGMDVRLAWGDAGLSELERGPPADAMLLQKKLPGRRTLARLRRLAPRLFYDLDDATWTRPGRDFSWLTRWRLEWRFRHLSAAAECCVAANQVLARRLEGYGARAMVIGMGIDTGRWVPAPRPADATVRIGWAGAPGNLPFLRRLAPLLATVAERHPTVRLQVLCGADPRLPGFAWTPWSRDAEIPFVQGLDIGLLPLPDDSFARGKSPIKALQYQACGVAVIGDAIGASTELLGGGRGLPCADAEGWAAGLEQLIGDPALRSNLAAQGLAAVRAQHERRDCAEAWRRIFTSR